MPSPTISARIPQPLYDRLYATANELGINPSELIARAIYAYLDELQTPDTIDATHSPDSIGLELGLAAIADQLESLSAQVNRLQSQPVKR